MALEANKMKVTYIYHSSFLAETDSCTMLFDYFRGILPPIAEDKPLYIFASHSHEDHFSERIFSVAQGRTAPITYVLSDDIFKSRVPENCAKNTIFLGPHETWTDGLINVRTLQSTDQGVAFCLDVPTAAPFLTQDDKEAICQTTPESNTLAAGPQTPKGSLPAAASLPPESKEKVAHIYYAGDMNNWWWPGDPDNERVVREYHQELGMIKGEVFDAAFVPLDSRLTESYFMGLDDFMERCDAKAIFPMHFWEKHDIIDQMKGRAESTAFADRIVYIGKEGQSWTL